MTRLPNYYGPQFEDDDNRIAERADELLAAYRTDPDKIAEADESWAGTLDGSTYADMEKALADLWAVDDDKVHGSYAMDRVFRLAKACWFARDQELHLMAGADARAEAVEAQSLASEY